MKRKLVEKIDKNQHLTIEIERLWKTETMVCANSNWIARNNIKAVLIMTILRD